MAARRAQPLPPAPSSGRGSPRPGWHERGGGPRGSGVPAEPPDMWVRAAMAPLPSLLLPAPSGPPRDPRRCRRGGDRSNCCLRLRLWRRRPPQVVPHEAKRCKQRQHYQQQRSQRRPPDHLRLARLKVPDCAQHPLVEIVADLQFPGYRFDLVRDPDHRVELTAAVRADAEVCLQSRRARDGKLAVKIGR